MLPSFVDFTHLECFNLSTEGLVHAKKVTSVIEHTNPDITYCPLLFPLVSVLLHYTDPSTTYNCIYSLLRRKEDEYITQTKVSYEAAKFVIRDLAKKYAVSIYSICIPLQLHKERSGSVVECLTWDPGAADSSLVGITVLWSLSKIHLS